MRYQAEVVADHELPPGIDRVLVERRGIEPLILVRASAAPPILMWLLEAWASR